MTYTAFKEHLITELSGYFPPDTSISIQSIPRNNNISVDGLTILESGYNIAPTIYIREYYHQLQQGLSFSFIYQKILDTYYQYRPMDNIDTSLFADFNNVRHHIVFKLVHYEKNKELLEHVPYIPFLDLAIVFYCLITSNASGTATILIQNSHLVLWNTCISELYQLAQKNTPHLLPSCFEKLSHLLSGHLPTPRDEKKEDSGNQFYPIYVLTNESRFLGAACMLYEGLTEKIAKDLNSDFYIIPSSIHEVLIIPTVIDMSTEDINQMIQEVNKTQLEPEEVLSDHFYTYNRTKKQISASYSG